MPGVITQTTIANLESEVIARIENRTTQTARADVWIRDSLLEISGNPDYRDSFPELELLGPFFNLTGGAVGVSVQEYDEGNFIPSGDFLIKTLDIVIWVDYPTNTILRQLNPSNYQDTDKFQKFPSLPTEWYRRGLNIGFNPPPNQNYQTQACIQRRHPITDYYNTSNQLNTTPILLPVEWNEVLTWCAAMRGYAELLEFERAGEIRTMLWGDPAHPNDNPGLIASVKTKRRAEAWMQQQILRPVVRGVCWGSS